MKKLGCWQRLRPYGTRGARGNGKAEYKKASHRKPVKEGGSKTRITAGKENSACAARVTPVISGKGRPGRVLVGH